jgi:sulfotransferase family protein
VKPLLVIGVPRSGTTWVGRVLRFTEGARYVNEPDNEHVELFALHAKRRLGRWPVLAPGDRAPGYERVWSRAFAGGVVRRVSRKRQSLADRFYPPPDAEVPPPRVHGWEGVRVRIAAALEVRRAPRPAGPVIVKTVFAHLALDWLAERFRPDVLIVLRDPLNVIASQTELDPKLLKIPALGDHPEVLRRVVEPLGLPAPDPDASPVGRRAWNFGLLTAAMMAAAARHPGWHIVRHEDLLVDSQPAFRSLVDRLGLTWTDRCGRYLEASNTPGSGYSTNRLASEQRDRWRRTLNDDQVREVEATLARFPVPDWRFPSTARPAAGA